MTREELLRLKASLPRTSDDPHYGIELWREDVDALIALALAALDAEAALEWCDKAAPSDGVGRAAADSVIGPALAAIRKARGDKP